MVLYVKPTSGETTCSEDSPLKSSICQPRDNIGISCIFSSGDPIKDKSSTGGRRKYTIPQDNLGVACLPNAEHVKLRNMPDVTENHPVGEIHVNTRSKTPACNEQKLHPKTTKTSGKARCAAPKDNLSSSGRHVNGTGIAQVRLQGGEDGDQVTRVESFDIGISNIRRPKHDPTKPRKPIVPKDNIGFSGRHLQKSLIRASAPKATTAAVCNIKKISRGFEKRGSSSKSLSNWSSEKHTISTHNKSLNTNRHKPK